MIGKDEMWITMLHGKRRNTIDIETAAYTRKEAIEKAVAMLSGKYTWRKLYRWGRRARKIKINVK